MKNNLLKNTTIQKQEINVTLFNQDSNKVSYTKDGYMVQKDVPIARTGKFVYRADQFGIDNEDGIRSDELLSFLRGSDSFNDENINKMNSVSIPFTNDHPNKGTLITSKNAADHLKGIMENIYFSKNDGILYAGRIIVYDEETIEDIKSGKKEVSIGFDALYKFNSFYFKNEFYDGTETILRVNHCSLVVEGAAGPQYRMHEKNNSTIEEIITMSEKSEKKAMVSIMVNGVSIEIPAEQAQLIKTEQTNNKIDSLHKRVEVLVSSFNKLINLLNKNEEIKEGKGDFPTREAQPGKEPAIDEKSDDKYGEADNMRNEEEDEKEKKESMENEEDEKKDDEEDEKKDDEEKKTDMANQMESAFGNAESHHAIFNSKKNPTMQEIQQSLASNLSPTEEIV